jgi:hypothetical protein
MLSLVLAPHANALPAGADPIKDLNINMVTPHSFKLLRSSGKSSLYEAVLPANSTYSLGPVLVADLHGDRFEVGRAYSALLGNETLDVYHRFLSHHLPDPKTAALFEKFADWIWDRAQAAHVPADFIKELDGMRSASPVGSGNVTVDLVSRRFNTLGNLPADTQNLINSLLFELEKGMPPAEAALINAVINALDKCTWCSKHWSRPGNLPLAPGCDAFGVWGSRTAGGRLFSSRNLDWEKDSGIGRHKLVNVMHIDGVAQPYAMIGFASGFGAIAGMSAAGITTSEMNLDNALTTFDGPPFPIRLKMVLERAATLADARALWEATNNTDSMNFFIASGVERSAYAIEAVRACSYDGSNLIFIPPPMQVRGSSYRHLIILSSYPHPPCTQVRGFSRFFGDNDAAEAAATCNVGSTAGGTCGDTGFPDVPASGGKKAIGMPLADAVWRTNHAVHADIMPTQEPLFNGTTFRYELLRDLFAHYAEKEVLIGDAEAVAVTATLGIKGHDFLSCDPAQFADGDNIMSIAYAPKGASGDPGHAWVAWEDGTGDGWRPAACSPYVRIDFARWWGA